MKRRASPYFEIHLLEGGTSTPVDARENKAAAVAQARSLLRKHGFNYRVCKVAQVYTTEGDPACARFTLEEP